MRKNELKFCKSNHPEDVEEYPDDFDFIIGRKKNAI